MKTFWTIFITVIVMAGLGAGGYYYLNSKQTKEKNDLQAQIDDLNEKLSAAQTTSTDSSTSASTSATASSTSWKNYSNTKYGFSITFNDVWKNFKIVEKASDISSAKAYLYVCIPTTSTVWSDQEKNYFCPFAITAIESDKWSAYLEATEPLTPTRIGQNANYVFAYNTAQDRPDDGVAAMNDIKNIIATFKGI